MRYYVRRSDTGKILGPHTLQELQGMAWSGNLNPDVAQALEARGQSSFQLQSSNEWESVQSLFKRFNAAPSGPMTEPSRAANPAGAVIPKKPQSGPAARLATRYRDAYFGANAVVCVGGVIKTVGIAAGILLLLGGLLAAGSAGSRLGGDAALLLAIAGSLVAVIVGGIVYLFGILLSAQGQILLATLDTAVNSSNQLTDEERSRIMSL